MPFFLRGSKFCGRIFTPGGVAHDPNRIKSLVSMPSPATAAELMQSDNGRSVDEQVNSEFQRDCNAAASYLREGNEMPN